MTGSPRGRQMSLSHRIGLRADRSRSRRALTLGACALLLGSGLVSSLPAQATHPVSTLSGSSFEIDDDANLKVDDAGNLDWANVNETRKQDTTSGPTDESFGQGTKEDTAVPSVVDGGIPPNKSDLKFFGVYQEGSTASGFLHLFWSRVQEPSGTTNMDFEFNHVATRSANGVTPVRSAGDLLIQYDLSQGGTNPTIAISRWVTTGATSQCQASNKLPCWSTKSALSGTDAAASINSSSIAAADADGIGSLTPRTFGEASVRLSSLFDPTKCESFGAAYLKSRSSDSFTAALKDFVPPADINISNCGNVKIIKTDDLGNPLDGATFELYKDNAPIGGTRGD